MHSRSAGASASLPAQRKITLAPTRLRRYKRCLMLSLRFAVLFIHIVAVIVALGGSLFSTFALAPVLAAELDPPARLRVARRIVRRLGAIVLTVLAVLVVTGIFNVLFIGGVSILLAIKLILVVAVIALALYQYGSIGVQIWRISAAGRSGSRRPPGAFSARRSDRRLDRVADCLSLDRTHARLRRDCHVDSLRVHRCHEKNRRAQRPPGCGDLPRSRSRSALSRRSATAQARTLQCDTSTRRWARGRIAASLQSSECAAAAVGMLIGIRFGARLVNGSTLRNRSMIAAVILCALVLPIVAQVGAETARLRFASGASATHGSSTTSATTWECLLTSF